MKICYLMGGFKRGGIARVVSILSNQQINNYDVNVMSLLPPEPNETYKIDKRIKRCYLLKKYSSFKYLFYAPIKLRKFIKSEKIDILIACGNIFYPMAVCCKLGNQNLKVICWEHSNVFNTHDNRGQTLFRKMACLFSDKIVVLTDADKKGFQEKLNAKRIQRIYNPFDPTIKSKPNQYQNKKKIISVGRFCYQKHFEVIPEIGHLLDKYLQDWQWDIYGDGETYKDVEELINKYNLGAKIHLKGLCQNIYDKYNEYDVLAMTSRYEGFSMVLLEACACNIPMVSYDILTGPNEIIADGCNGFLINEGDLETFAKRLASILNDKNYRDKLALNNKEVIKKFQVDDILNQWDLLFKELTK